MFLVFLQVKIKTFAFNVYFVNGLFPKGLKHSWAGGILPKNINITIK